MINKEFKFINDSQPQEQFIQNLEDLQIYYFDLNKWRNQKYNRSNLVQITPKIKLKMFPLSRSSLDFRMDYCLMQI